VPRPGLRRSTVLAGFEEPSGPALRPPERWLRCRHARTESLPPLLAHRLRVEVVVETPAGHAYLGRVTWVGRWVLSVLGRERPLRLPAGARIDVLPEHTWQERREVILRQRAGEPGAEIDRGRERCAASSG